MSAHNQVVQKLEDLKNQKGSLPSRFYKQSEKDMSQYQKRLEASDMLEVALTARTSRSRS